MQTWSVLGERRSFLVKEQSNVIRVSLALLDAYLAR